MAKVEALPWEYYHSKSSTTKLSSKSYHNYDYAGSCAELLVGMELETHNVHPGYNLLKSDPTKQLLRRYFYAALAEAIVAGMNFDEATTLIASYFVSRDFLVA